MNLIKVTAISLVFIAYQGRINEIQSRNKKVSFSHKKCWGIRGIALRQMQCQERYYKVLTGEKRAKNEKPYLAIL